MIPYEILIRGDKDGKLSGSHCIDIPGADARPITPEDLADIAPAINAAAIAEIKQLEVSHAEAIAAKDAEIAALTAARDEAVKLLGVAETDIGSRDAYAATLEARIAELTAVPETPDIITQLNTAFKSALPPEAQAAFAMPYAIVRVLVEAEQYALAAAVISGITVPPELEAAKANLIALLPN